MFRQQCYALRLSPQLNQQAACPPKKFGLLAETIAMPILVQELRMTVTALFH